MESQDYPAENSLDKCQICNGTKKTYDMLPCYFCNETGLRNRFAESFMRNHICLCSRWDRKHCPICKKKCHHDSSLKPRVLMSFQ